MTSENLANPGPLGLLGFGMATIVLSMFKLGVYEMNAVILAVALFLGGIAQVFAGLMEYKRNRMFTATVFTFFGMFWILFAVMNKGLLGTVEPDALVVFYFLLFLLAIVLFIGSRAGGSKVVSITFAFLVVLLALLTIGTFTGENIIIQIAGAVGIVTGGGAFYIACAEMLNEQYKKPVLPL
ncbi:MAG: acetate uptake transporter [Methanomassiliicoccaceae archaeon]|nr:acetate uptake transporter [Methanomassiliicoccaceae archaeon]